MRRLIITTIRILALVLVVTSAVEAARYGWAVTEVRRAWQKPTAAHVPDLGTTTSLEILPLVDEAASRAGLRAEHGVAYLIKTDHDTILMDLGWNQAGTDPSPLLHNMREMGVQLDDVDTIFISHPHPDHLGGLSWWLDNTFSLGATQASLGSRPVYTPVPLDYPGLQPIVAVEPVVIGEAVATTGAIPFVDVFPFWLRRPQRAEQALAVNVAGQGIVLITGCSHPTMERMVARAQAVFDQPIVGIVGGLHYEGKTAADVQPGIRFVQALQPRLIALSPHDSTPAAMDAFRAAFPDVYRDVTVGQAITFGRQTAGTVQEEVR